MRSHTPIAAVDARTLVPVKDEAGGVVVYVGGRAAYYVMNGEWFAALPEPASSPSPVESERVFGMPEGVAADPSESTS